MHDLIERQAAIDSIEKHLRFGDELYPLTDTDKVLNHGFEIAASCVYNLPSAQPETHEERTETHACDLISRQAAIDALTSHIMPHNNEDGTVTIGVLSKSSIKNILNKLPSAQPDTEKICARIKAEAIKRNVEYMKHGDRYMLGFVDGMRLARRIVDGTIDDPVYFTLSGE